ncbi:hypothetical protein SLEP1_g5353 [Rubroshorea leprosula]|uniref:Uncharacterized protein n=1 Tax=Rubroshorea leprosula TaxID=152421 RepID=A0AAV5HZL2_9ROSI|nr:hypothetical protein SLEP1_g5353 [Rubroshorea leprosula]
MVVNPSASNSVLILASGSISIPTFGFVLILASVGSCVFFLLLHHFSVLMERNPSKSTVMAPVARDIAEMGVDPIVKVFPVLAFVGSKVSLSSSESKCFDIFHFPGWDTASKNNTTFIASILLSLAPPNLPLIPTAKIVKGGETGNAARNEGLTQGF